MRIRVFNLDHEYFSGGIDADSACDLPTLAMKGLISRCCMSNNGRWIESYILKSRLMFILLILVRRVIPEGLSRVTRQTYPRQTKGKRSPRKRIRKKQKITRSTSWCIVYRCWSIHQAPFQAWYASPLLHETVIWTVDHFTTIAPTTMRGKTVTRGVVLSVVQP